VRAALNFHLKPDPLPSSNAPRSPDDFDARFSALARHYRYRILARPAPPVLDRHRVWWVPQPMRAEAMARAAAVLVGPARLHHLPRRRLPGQVAGQNARCAGGEHRRRRDRHRGLGALLPAQPGALDGGLAEAGGRRQVDADDLRAALEAKDRAACGL
jgi:tRNA pseudouridine38-40 synthase